MYAHVTHACDNITYKIQRGYVSSVFSSRSRTFPTDWNKFEYRNEQFAITTRILRLDKLQNVCYAQPLRVRMTRQTIMISSKRTLHEVYAILLKNFVFLILRIVTIAQIWENWFSSYKEVNQVNEIWIIRFKIFEIVTNKSCLTISYLLPRFKQS